MSAMLRLFGLNCDILCLYSYKKSILLLLFCTIFYGLTRIFFWTILGKILLVFFFVQKHVYNQFPAQSPPEDRGREKRIPSKNHGQQRHRSAECGPRPHHGASFG
jgi:hypothetical protein